MNKLLISLLFAISIFSCGEYEPELPLPAPYVASDLAPYVNEFYNYSVIYDKPANEVLRVEWSDDLGKNERDKTVIGVCAPKILEGDYVKSVGPIDYERYTVEELWYEVYILQPAGWSDGIKNEQGQLYESCLRWVVFHELGHCALGLDHSEQPDTIMYRSLNGGCASPEFDKQWPDMVKQLFEGGDISITYTGGGGTYEGID